MGMRILGTQPLKLGNVWVSYTQEIGTFFASNIKFGISLNKVFVSKTFFVNVLLLFSIVVK